MTPMHKDAFLCDAEAINEDFESITRENGVGITSIQMMCVAIYRLLRLYVTYKVSRDV